MWGYVTRGQSVPGGVELEEIAGAGRFSNAPEDAA
jgi:hypothetical protein